MKRISVKRANKRKTNKSRKNGRKIRRGGGIGDVAKETAQNVGETVGSALTGTTKVAAKTVKAGTDLAATGVETTGKVGSNVLEGVGTASGAVKGVGTAVSNVGDLVGETSGQVTDVASKVTGTALKTTGDLVTGTASALSAGPRALSRILAAKSKRRIEQGKIKSEALDYAAEKKSAIELDSKKREVDAITNCVEYLNTNKIFDNRKREKYCECLVKQKHGLTRWSDCAKADNELKQLPDDQQSQINNIVKLGGGKRRRKSHKSHKKVKHVTRKSKRQNRRKTQKRHR